MITTTYVFLSKKNNMLISSLIVFWNVLYQYFDIKVMYSSDQQ